MRVKASEVRDAAASSYWFTSGTAGRQVFDVAVAEGIDATYADGTNPYSLAAPWYQKSAMDYLNHMAQQGLPTHQCKAMSALLAVTKIGIKTVKSKNLLNPQTGRALLKAYVNDDENFLDNEYTMLGGLPSGSTMAFTSLLTGKTETLTMLDSTHFVIPSDGWLQITGTLPESIICTWNGEKDQTAADEYATESHTWDVTQMYGTKSGGTEGHYYRAFGEGMRGMQRFNILDSVDLSIADSTTKNKVVDLGVDLNWTWVANSGNPYVKANLPTDCIGVRGGGRNEAMCANYVVRAWGSNALFFAQDKAIYFNTTNQQTPHVFLKDSGIISTDIVNSKISKLNGVKFCYPLNDTSVQHFTSLFLSASSTADELTAMPADAIPLSEIQFADNNWSIEEAVYDAPEADANGVIDTLHQCTGQMRIQYSLDAAEQILTLQTEYAALEARVSALENA